MRVILYIAFILSGAAGLIYESIWSQYLGLFVGHSAYAHIIVLAIFLGGMAVGALLIGQRSERLRAPLLWYAGVELIVGVLGLVFHDVYRGVTDLAYTVVFPHLAGLPGITIAKWGIASALIAPQSILLGTTFPLMSAGVLRRTAGAPGRVLALLYFANSMGAAVGVLLAGFWLVEAVGLPGTVLTAACLNVVVALIAFVVGRLPHTAPEASLQAAVATAVPITAEGGLPAARVKRVLLLVSFATAVASFIYEIAWIRMLALVLGSATHAFELMLSAFILGLALGALWVRQRVDRFRDPLRVLGIVQWVMGCAALATLPVYLASFTWMVDLLQAFAETPQGYTAFNLARYGIALAVMLPATFCAGITLPLITKTLVVAGHGERAIGWVYGLNTLGSIVGVGLAGLFFMPWVGLKTVQMIGASADMVVGVLLFAALARPWQQRFRLAAGALAATVLVVLGVTWGTTFNRLLLSSGVFRYGSLQAIHDYEVLFYKDGRTATIAALRHRNGTVSLTTNGKPDASLNADWFAVAEENAPRKKLQGDVAAQLLLALVTLAHAPHGKHMAVIGHGSGQSSHTLLGSPYLERLVTIDIEPEMVAGSRVFYPLNRRVFDDPRSVIVTDDARSFFAAEQRQYDLILSEPSNPWVSGVASLFTSEFYGRIAPLLTPQGVFGQWLHLYELNDDLVLSVLTALHHTFPSYGLFVLGRGDILVVASRQAQLPTPDWSVVQFPAIATDLQGFRPLTADSFAAFHLLDRAALVPLLQSWPEGNSDFFPVLDLGADRARYMRTQADGLLRLSKARVNITAPFVGRRLGLSQTLDMPIAGHYAMEARALGALSRLWYEHNVPMASFKADSRSAALQRLWQWRLAIHAGGPPMDWRLWMQQTARVEADLHYGTAGIAYEAFYHTVHRYVAEEHTPPALVCEAIRFLEGVAVWDFATAAQAADSLLESAAAGQAWLPVDHLRDGAVIAKLMVGDTAGARQYFQALLLQGEQPITSLGMKLLAAYISHAEQHGPWTAPAATSGVSWQCPNTAQAQQESSSKALPPH